MTVVGRALLLPMGWADGAIHIQHDDLRRLPLVNPVDPDTGEIGENGKVVIRRQQFRLEPAHLAGRGSAPLNGVAADDPAHRRVTAQSVSIVDIFVSGQSAIDRLSQEADQTVPAVLARPAIGKDFTRQRGQTKGVIEFPICESVASPMIQTAQRVFRAPYGGSKNFVANGVFAEATGVGVSGQYRRGCHVYTATMPCTTVSRLVWRDQEPYPRMVPSSGPGDDLEFSTCSCACSFGGGCSIWSLDSPVGRC